MTLLLLAGILVVAAGIVGATALAVRSKRKFQADNEVIPGRPTTAPAEWAGAHTPEARMHRRLVDVVAALRAHPLLEEGTGMLEARVTLEEQVAAIDEQLVAVAALPERVRADPLARIDQQVGLVEQAAADLAAAGAPTGADPAAIEQQVDDIGRHLDELVRIRAELDAIPPPPPPAPESRAEPA